MNGELRVEVGAKGMSCARTKIAMRKWDMWTKQSEDIKLVPSRANELVWGIVRGHKTNAKPT
jgi:hypothetical protein